MLTVCHARKNRTILLIPVAMLLAMGSIKAFSQQQFGPSPQMQYHASISTNGPTPELAYGTHFGPTAQNLYHQHPGDAPTYVNYGGQDLAPRYVAIRGGSVTRRGAPYSAANTGTGNRRRSASSRSVPADSYRTSYSLTGASIDGAARRSNAGVKPIHLVARTTG